MEDDHVVAAVLEMLQAADDPIRVVEQVRDEHDHSPLGDEIGDVMQGPFDIGLAAERQAIEREEDGAQLSGARAGGQHRDDAIVEGDQAHGIALPVHQVRERRGQALAVLELRHARRAVPHRRADIEDEMTSEVGLFLELLDVVAIGSGVDLPVNRRQVVARDVLPVLRELDAESLERAAVESRQHALDDGARLELERAQTRHDGGVQELPLAGAPRHGYIPLRGGGTVSISRSTITSDVMRSESA